MADNSGNTNHGSTVLRFPLGRSGLFAAAAVAGAIVYWRASERQRSRRQGGEIDAAVAQGREAAEAALRGSEVDRPTV